jgi:hypothetical protein
MARARTRKKHEATHELQEAGWAFNQAVRDYEDAIAAARPVLGVRDLADALGTSKSQVSRGHYNIEINTSLRPPQKSDP